MAHDKCKNCYNKDYRLDLCKDCKWLFIELSKKESLEDRYKPKINRESK